MELQSSELQLLGQPESGRLRGLPIRESCPTFESLLTGHHRADLMSRCWMSTFRLSSSLRFATHGDSYETGDQEDKLRHYLAARTLGLEDEDRQAGPPLMILVQRAAAKLGIVLLTHLVAEFSEKELTPHQVGFGLS